MDKIDVRVFEFHRRILRRRSKPYARNFAVLRYYNNKFVYIPCVKKLRLQHANDDLVDPFGRFSREHCGFLCSRNFRTSMTRTERRRLGFGEHKKNARVRPWHTRMTSAWRPAVAEHGRRCRRRLPVPTTDAIHFRWPPRKSITIYLFTSYSVCYVEETTPKYHCWARTWTALCTRTLNGPENPLKSKIMSQIVLMM